MPDTQHTGQTEPAPPPAGPAADLLDHLTTQATACGLAIYESWPPEDPYQISFANPASPGLGQATIDCCGLLSWERYCRFTPADIPAITAVMTALLSEDFSQDLAPEPPNDEPVDEFTSYLDESLRDPAFRGIFHDAGTRSLLLARLTALRTALGLTQAQVAGRMQAPPTLVSELEDGGADPHLSLLQRYARALGARLDITLTGPPALGEDPGQESP